MHAEQLSLLTVETRVSAAVDALAGICAHSLLPLLHDEATEREIGFVVEAQHLWFFIQLVSHSQAFRPR